jgi:hypothetical protein
MSGPVDVLAVAHWEDQAQLAVDYAMSRAPGDSKSWEDAMQDASEFRRLAALARVGGAS